MAEWAGTGGGVGWGRFGPLHFWVLFFVRSLSLSFSLFFSLTISLLSPSFVLLSPSLAFVFSSLVGTRRSFPLCFFPPPFTQPIFWLTAAHAATVGHVSLSSQSRPPAPAHPPPPIFPAPTTMPPHACLSAAATWQELQLQSSKAKQSSAEKQQPHARSTRPKKKRKKKGKLKVEKKAKKMLLFSSSSACHQKQTHKHPTHPFHPFLDSSNLFCRLSLSIPGSPFPLNQPLQGILARARVSHSLTAKKN